MYVASPFPILIFDFQNFVASTLLVFVCEVGSYRHIVDIWIIRVSSRLVALSECRSDFRFLDWLEF